MRCVAVAAAVCCGLAVWGTASAQSPTPGRSIQLKNSEATGLPIVHFYHGRVLDHELREIPATTENIRAVLTGYLDSINRKTAGATSSQMNEARSRVQGSAGAEAELLLDLRAGAWAIENSNAPDKAQYIATLKAIEAWASSGVSGPAVARAKSNPGTQSALRQLRIPAPAPVVTPQAPAAAPPPTYIQQCRDAKVPIPPDWGSPDWKIQGTLESSYTFASDSNKLTEIWAYTETGVKGVCLALPRINKTTDDIELLGIVCQSKETGKACFWDNVDRAAGLRIQGDAVKGMKIANIQDGSNLGENCTNCHRGYNAFPIHPGTALDLGHKFDLTPDRRYEPISGQPTWGNPEPLIKIGEPPCGSCHEIPNVKEDNGQNPKAPSSYCDVVLKNAVNKTMPYVGNAAGWETPRPAYQVHVDFLRKLCETQTVAGGPN